MYQLLILYSVIGFLTYLGVIALLIYINKNNDKYK